MFKETPEGQTHYCTHTTDNSICKECLGIKVEEAAVKAVEEYKEVFEKLRDL